MADPTVTQDVYVTNMPGVQEVTISNPSDFGSIVTQGISDFYTHYVVTTTDQTIQVFQSFTYGEMTIALLLFVLVLLFGLKWLWEVLQ